MYAVFSYACQAITPGVTSTMTTSSLSVFFSRDFLRSRILRGAMLFAASLTIARAQLNYAIPYSFSTSVGAVSAGSVDGPGSVARFDSPSGIAVDPSGSIYVSDAGNGTIRKISPTGVVTTLAGKAGAPFVPHTSLDGTGAAAYFGEPEGLAVDSNGIIFVVGDNTVRKITPSGVVTTVGGSIVGLEFNSPKGVAIDPIGNIYVADIYDIKRIAVTGGVPTLVAGGSAGTADGTGNAANFLNPSGVAIGPAGEIYVADTANQSIRKVSPGGVVTTFAGTAGGMGYEDGSGTAARFHAPEGLAADAAGNLYVADSGNSVIRKITPGGLVTTVAGRPGQDGHVDGAAASALFFGPRALALDAFGNLLVAESSNNTIRKITPGGIVSTIAGLSPFEARGNADGAGSAARFDGPAGICRGADGSFFVADRYNNTIRKITAAGVVSTYASGDGKFNLPCSLTMSSSGSLYVADYTNIWRIAPDGVVSLFFANLYEPSGCAFDSAGNLIVADSHNFVIRKIAPDGTGTVLAGSSGVRGYQNGTGSDARFGYMGNLAVDAADNVFLADYENKVIRKITPGGVVTTLAGTQYGAADGPGNEAEFLGPWGLTLDEAGTIFVTDLGTMIRRITPGGMVSAVAGTPGNPSTLDGVGSSAHFESLGGITVDGSGALYVVSGGPRVNVVRKGLPAGAPVISAQPNSKTVATGGSVQFSVVAEGEPAPTYQWYLNGAIFAGATSDTLSFTNVHATDAGDYTVVVTNALGNVTSAKATLTISTASKPTPDPTPSSGGGGSMTAQFICVLALLGAVRFGREAVSNQVTGRIVPKESQRSQASRI